MSYVNLKQHWTVQDLFSSGWEDYELLDSGNQKKLERFGNFTIARFEPEAIWKPALRQNEWLDAAADYSFPKGQKQGIWSKTDCLPSSWCINLDRIQVNIFIIQSRHIGIFPEQLPIWLWMKNKIRKSDNPPALLNLFGYTGVSSVISALAGAKVTHIDASKNAIRWGKKNLTDSGLSQLPVRWIIDDSLKFVQREIRRGNFYDAVIIDPPSFGRGPKGEVWKFEKSILELLMDCKKVLSGNPLFFLINSYNVEMEPMELGKLLSELLSSFPGKIQCGYLVQQEKSAGRKIRQSMYAYWENQ